MLDVWKFFTMVSGGQCVMMAGQTPTLKWCVDSLVTGNVNNA